MAAEEKRRDVEGPRASMGKERGVTVSVRKGLNSGCFYGRKDGHEDKEEAWSIAAVSQRERTVEKLSVTIFFRSEAWRTCYRLATGTVFTSRFVSRGFRHRDAITTQTVSAATSRPRTVLMA